MHAIEPVVRPLHTEDLPRVLAIQAGSFSRPWDEDSYRQELGLDWSHVEVLADPGGGGVLGVCTYWIVAGEVHLLNIATDPDRRRTGLGTRLLRHVLERGAEAQCERVLLEVRRSNGGARAFYERHGFTVIAERARYYPDNGEDALVMERLLVDTQRWSAA